jgi:hypothetical protein
LALGAVADFGAQNSQYTTKVDVVFNVQLNTSPAIEPNPCYVLLFSVDILEKPGSNPRLADSCFTILY